MNPYMAADTQGDQQIRSVVSSAMMDHQRRVFAAAATAESIALWFKSIGHEAWFSYYLTAVIAASLIVYVGMRDTKRHTAIGRHE